MAMGKANDPLAFAAAAIFVQPVTTWVLHWTAQAPLSLARPASLSSAVEFVVEFLLLDLGFYYWHLANHRIFFSGAFTTSTTSILTLTSLPVSDFTSER